MRERPHMVYVQCWLLAIRPKTLTAAVVPVLVGTALAAHLGHGVRLWLSFFALMSALLIQIGTNLFNDAIDFIKGSDTEERIGPERVTQSGLLSHDQVLLGGCVSFILATLFAIPLVVIGGWPIIGIGFLSLICGYAYTGGPFPLAYHGLGEVFVVIFFGIIAVLGVTYLQTGEWYFAAVVAGIQIGLLATALLAINNVRDREADEICGKRTLAVRFGVFFGKGEIAFLCLLPFKMGSYWFSHGSYLAMFLPLLVLPIAITIVAGVIRHAPGPRYNLYLGAAALLHFVFGIFLAGGLYWD